MPGQPPRSPSWVPEGAINILYRKEMAAAEDPKAAAAKIVSDYKRTFLNPYVAADVGQIDEIIEPKETRPQLIAALEILRGKVGTNPPKKHGLMPM